MVFRKGKYNTSLFGNGKSKKSTGVAKKGRRRPKRKPKKALSKKEYKAVEKIVKRKLDEAIEDKYILQTSYTEQKTVFTPTTGSMLFNISPTILKGTDISNRTGNNVKFKYLRMMVRYLPAKQGAFGVVDSSAPTYSENWHADMPDATVYFVRVTSKLAQSLSTSALEEACMVKFRMPGKMWQDYAQDSGQESVASIKLLDKFKMKTRYRSLTVPTTQIDSNGTIAITGLSFTNTPIYQPSCTNVQVPQYSYYDMYCKAPAFAQKVEIENTFNKPLRYQYWVFVQLSTGFQVSTWNKVEQPESFATRTCLVFEDA